MPETRPAQFETPACRQFDRELADYLEGEERPGVAAHARECPFCEVVLKDLELICRKGRELQDDDPPARVWAAVRATLRSEGVIREPARGEPVQEGRGWRWMFGPGWNPSPALAVACLTLLGLLTVWQPPTSLERSETSAQRSAGSNFGEANLVEAGDLPALVQTVQEMESNFQSGDIEPVVKATYQKSLRSLDDSIRECSDSVRYQPDNALARQYLLTAYAQKADVLASALEYDGRQRGSR